MDGPELIFVMICVHEMIRFSPRRLHESAREPQIIPNYFVRADLTGLHFEVPLAENVLT